MNNIIQLYGVDGQDLGLFAFDTKRYDEATAAAMVEHAIEDAYQLELSGEMEDGDDVLTHATEALEEIDITRVYAAIANTNRL
jgi:hypothetical protein